MPATRADRDRELYAFQSFVAGYLAGCVMQADKAAGVTWDLELHAVGGELVPSFTVTAAGAGVVVHVDPVIG